ncbi:MAG: MBL fold metallo-hydrolase, partial [Bdellovibrionales bacterium]|nr:MBL fold metallo-hydrolase [Bdellovibrionales bacterium]
MFDWTHGSWRLRGLTRAGVSTCYSLLGCDLAFDVAQGFASFVPVSRFFITHGHMDHAAGIPYIISQRALNHLKPASFYMPIAMVDKMADIMNSWQEIEGHKYSYSFVPVQLGSEISLRTDLMVRPFSTFHRIPSLGYTLFKKRKSLRPELASLQQEEIRKLKIRGEEVDSEEWIPEISFTGDTKIEFFDQNEWVRKSRILVMEVTYINESKSVQVARDWGHIHLDELIPRLKDFEGEKILLTHLSSRHSVEECKEKKKKKLPKE